MLFWMVVSLAANARPLESMPDCSRRKSPALMFFGAGPPERSARGLAAELTA